MTKKIKNRIRSVKRVENVSTFIICGAEHFDYCRPEGLAPHRVLHFRWCPGQIQRDRDPFERLGNPDVSPHRNVTE